MAAFSLSLSSCILLSLLLVSSSTSTSNDDQQFELLDVAASLQQARQVFSPMTVQQQQQQQQREGEGEGGGSLSPSLSLSLSLSLHPRASLPSFAPATDNYTALSLSRLGRDEARVRSLLLRHSLALKVSAQQQQLQAPVTSGIRLGSGEYFARIGVGRPAKELYMVIDSGSDISWLQCQPCADCYNQSDPIFNPSDSSTYKSLSCASPQCSALEVSACRTDACLYQVSYGDGSYTVGNFATETISFGFGASGAAPNVAIGCGHHNQGLFAGAAGLLGLGGGPLSLPSQIKATSFSYCLVNRDSTASSTLDFNSPRPPHSLLAPLLANPRINTYRYVALTGINVAGRPVPFPPSLLSIAADGRGGVIIDSGTAVTRLRAEVYTAVRDAFAAMAQNLPRAAPFSLFDTCYDLSGMTTVRVPTLSLHFAAGNALPLRPTNFLIPVDDAGKYCFAFAGTTGTLSIIGNVQQQGTRLTYDLANKLIAFTPNKC